MDQSQLAILVSAIDLLLSMICLFRWAYDASNHLPSCYVSYLKQVPVEQFFQAQVSIVLMNPVSLSLINRLAVICMGIEPGIGPFFDAAYFELFFPYFRRVILTNPPPRLNIIGKIRCERFHLTIVRPSFHKNQVAGLQNSRSFSSNQRDLVINACNNYLPVPNWRSFKKLDKKARTKLNKW